MSTEETEVEGEQRRSEMHADRVSNIQGVTLLDDEELLFDLRPAWYGGMTLKRLALWTVATTVTLGLALLYFWYPALKMWRSSKKVRYIVTSERVVIKDEGGLLGTKRTEEFPIRNVSDIQTRATWFEQRAGVGTVTLKERDGKTSEIALTSIPNYEEVASTIGGYQRRESKQSRHYGER
ncbi:PH domain-containing protein [Halogeometricum limi]|uniref:PH domain-containing protein n=1 Tax=Halogeometricum limi TaxID=555875 RepID=A0A1I6ISZ8_9EURY|nr:PH domain-containing protein [Halogeometricum limi]SFR69862.1 PH domain-containing protein [Halogeometricum limi]